MLLGLENVKYINDNTGSHCIYVMFVINFTEHLFIITISVLWINNGLLKPDDWQMAVNDEYKMIANAINNC